MTEHDREHISFIAPTFPRMAGGGARTIYEHANGLVARGYRVSVVHSLSIGPGIKNAVLDTARQKVRDLRAGGVRRAVSWMRIDPRVEMLTIKRFDESTVLPPADLRVGTYWRTSEFLGERPGDGTPYMQLIQAYEDWAGPVDRVEATWRLPIQTAVVSTALRKKGLELGVPADRLHLVPNGLDHQVFRPSHPIAGRPQRVAFLASDSPVKGLPDALAVAQAVYRARPEIPIVAFGARRHSFSLPPHVQYLHGLAGSSLVDEIYDSASIFLCTSLSEGWGFPSIEAMACGAALVSTRNGGVDDFAQHGDSALLADVGDVEALSGHVLELLENESLRDKIAARGVESAARFSWKSSTDAFEHVVRHALDTNG